MSTMTNPYFAHRTWRLVMMAILLGGCAGLSPKPVPDPNLHVLAAGQAATPAPAMRTLVLEVSAPRASPGFDTPRMVYVQRPYELDHFANNRWADAPARMLGPLLTQALEQSGGFRTVVQAPTAVPADVRVNTELIRLQQNFSMRPSRAEVELRVQLVDARARRVLATRVFEETETAPSDDAYGGVAGANAALARVLVQVVDFCFAETANRSVPANSAP
ncbi:MAG: ABC-type transport auxiliary lipoprotein family protein [Burkholderiales bacterium]|jgi:cholesterol transport system auxiliary component|nr:ABC-type transport auxiliary lipoprotein family protein [Burkholderiales bacterium]